MASVAALLIVGLRNPSVPRRHSQSRERSYPRQVGGPNGFYIDEALRGYVVLRDLEEVLLAGNVQRGEAPLAVSIVDIVDLVFLGLPVATLKAKL